MTPYLACVLIFVALSSACWFVSIALYRGTIGGTDPAVAPDYKTTTALAIGIAALTSFIPFPGGYVTGLFVWAMAAFAGLGLPTGRACIVFAYLAASSFVARLVVLGIMELLGL